jgi:hypothetical protein
MNKFCLCFLITLILAGGRFAQACPQAEPSSSSVPAQETIRVPEGNGKPVLLDGLFARGEWDDALKISINDRIELCLKVNSGHLFLGLKYDEAVGVVTDIWMASDDKTVYQMHSSGQLGEGALSLPIVDDKTVPIIMGYTKDWDANEIKSDSKKKAEWQEAGRPKEGYRQTLFPSDGKEFQIVLSKFSGRRLKIRLMSGDSKGLVIYPKNTDLKSTKNWLELIVPESSPVEDQDAKKRPDSPMKGSSDNGLVSAKVIEELRLKKIGRIMRPA